jgi:hypothetical protein
MSAAYQAFAAAGWGDTIPFSLGPCPCCDVVTVACCPDPVPRTLYLTISSPDPACDVLEGTYAVVYDDGPGVWRWSGSIPGVAVNPVVWEVSCFRSGGAVFWDLYHTCGGNVPAGGGPNPGTCSPVSGSGTEDPIVFCCGDALTTPLNYSVSA